MLLSRRSLFETIPAARLLQSLGITAALPLIPRSHAQVTPAVVRYAPEVEPLVALIERTPRDKASEMVVEQLRSGVSYREIMAALFLAGIRNVNPRPPGFALHCVFVIHAAHLISQQAPSDSRLLPLFYALDVFKAAQERDAGASTGDYTMRPIREPLSPATTAVADFSAAMESWDVEKAERTVVSLARYRNAAEAFELLRRYGVRDYRNIGHKAIFVANADRTLQAIGWQHSEPVLRSLVLGLLDFGKEQKVNGYAFADQCYLANVKRVSKSLPRMDGAWVPRASDPAAARSILKDIRTATPDEACATAAERLIEGTTTVASVWDAVHLAGAELRMRVSGGASIIGIHSVTACNGLHHAYVSATNPAVRLLVLLQAVGWMGQFRAWAETRTDGVGSMSITDLEPTSGKDSESALADLFSDPASNINESAGRAMRFAQTAQGRQTLLHTATRLTLGKADDVHYYKYLASLIEDIPLVSAEWRPHLTAAVVYYTKGASDADPAWAKRAKAALA